MSIPSSIRSETMEFWKPTVYPRFDAWAPSERDVKSEVNFWIPTSDPQGTIPLPSAEPESGGVTFWKPAFQSNWKPSPGSEEAATSSVWNWKWTPSSESDEVTGLWKWKPSKPGGGSDWKWTLVDKAHGTWKFVPTDQVRGIFGRKLSSLPPLPPLPLPPTSSLPKPQESVNFTGTSCLPTTLCTSDEPIEYYNRRHRRHDARLFRKEYEFMNGRKTWICPSGMHSWSDKCYDASWVAVHGMDSICVVTRRKDLDMARVGSFFQRCCTNRQTLSKLVEAVISEVECLRYCDEDLREESGFIEKPFGVVSVIPVTKNVDAESGHEGDSGAAESNEEKTIEFLKEKITSGSAFTFDETIQTAISAFQHLCPETNLEAIDIWVTVWNERRTEHLRLEQIKEHLNVIRGVSRGGFSSSSNVVSHSSSCFTTDSNSNGLRSLSEAMEKVKVSYSRLACCCGSKVCGGNGWKPCEIGVMWEKWVQALEKMV